MLGYVSLVKHTYIICLCDSVIAMLHTKLVYYFSLKPETHQMGNMETNLSKRIIYYIYNAY